LPNYLDSKKPVKSSKYGASKAPSYPRPPAFNSYGSGGSSSASPLLHGHDFVPLRGKGSGGGAGGFGGGSSATGYSYGVGSGLQSDGDFDDYRDVPSPYSSRPLPGGSGGPKSFVSMTRSNLDESDPGDVFNIDHGRGLYEGVKGPPRDYRGYSSADHDYEDDTYRGHGPTKSTVPKSPYYYRSSDYAHEPSSTSVQSRIHDVDGKPPKSKAYWRMSYVQDI